MDSPNTTPNSMPEKIIAFIGKNFPIIAIGTGLFLLWGKVLPYLIAVLEGSLIALGYAAILFVIILLAMSPEVRMVSYNIFRKFTRGLVEAMVKLDPLGNMKTYRDDIRGRELPNIMKNLQKISGLVERVRSQIAKNLESARSYLRKAEAAKSKEDERSMNLFLEQAGTYKTSAEALTPMLNTIENQQAFYVKVKELAEYMFQKLNTEIEVKETEFSLIMEGQQIMNSAKKAMGKDPRYQMFVQSSMEIAHRFDDLVGEMKTLMADSEKHFVDMEYEKAGNAAVGKDMLDEFENRRKGILQKLDAPMQPRSGNVTIATGAKVRNQVPMPGSSSSKKSLFHKQ